MASGFGRCCVCTASATGKEVQVRTRLEQGVGGGLDSVYTGYWIEDDFALLRGVVGHNADQVERAQLDHCSVLRPLNCRVVDDISVLSQLYPDCKPHRSFRQP